ncbi:MAG: hypothetical protein M1837_005462 [Sclerophora amabilis]|nr:MAG: hypothetical protein M1837_005462 [Sclerophora amabilis]
MEVGMHEASVQTDVPVAYSAGGYVAASISESHPNSQESFTSSNAGPPLLNASSNVSQLTSADTDPTPPTSSHGPSSQNAESQPKRMMQLANEKPGSLHTTSENEEEKQSQYDAPGARKVGHDKKESEPTQFVDDSATCHTHRFATHEAAGQKRTASGTVKSSSASSPTDMVNGTTPTTPGRSETTSTASAGHRVGELSSQLRARLSYAMVKVQHGWQSRSIDEVESIATIQASPRSTKSTFRGAPQSHISPTAASFSLSRENSGKSYGSDDTRMSSASPESIISSIARVSNGVSRFGGPYSQNPDMSAASGRTYESFWRDHGTTSVARILEAQRAVGPPKMGDGSHAPASLAPPANIVSSRQPRRSPNPDERHLPTLSTSFPRDEIPASAETPSSSSRLPSTPPDSKAPRREPVVRTPSQKRAMEQDAVETLLFMSSPGNSQNTRDLIQQQQHQQQQQQTFHHSPRHHPNVSIGPQPSTSTSTSTSNATETRIPAEDHALGDRDGILAATTTTPGVARQSSQGRSGDDEIDARLDEMSDDSSEEEL